MLKPAAWSGQGARKGTFYSFASKTRQNVPFLAADADPYMKHAVVRDQLRRSVNWALSTYEFHRLHSYALVYAEALYWLALEKELE